MYRLMQNIEVVFILILALIKWLGLINVSWTIIILIAVTLLVVEIKLGIARSDTHQRMIRLAETADQAINDLEQKSQRNR